MREHFRGLRGRSMFNPLDGIQVMKWSLPLTQVFRWRAYIRESQPIDAASNVFRTFVNVDDLSNAILELCTMNFTGTLHVGPTQKEIYYTFYMKRFKQLGWSTETLVPSTINDPCLSLDTSLNTQKAYQLLRTKFRTL